PKYLLYCALSLPLLILLLPVLLVAILQSINPIIPILGNVFIPTLDTWRGVTLGLILFSLPLLLVIRCGRSVWSALRFRWAGVTADRLKPYAAVRKRDPKGAVLCAVGALIIAASVLMLSQTAKTDSLYYEFVGAFLSPEGKLAIGLYGMYPTTTDYLS